MTIHDLPAIYHHLSAIATICIMTMLQVRRAAHMSSLIQFLPGSWNSDGTQMGPNSLNKSFAMSWHESFFEKHMVHICSHDWYRMANSNSAKPIVRFFKVLTHRCRLGQRRDCSAEVGSTEGETLHEDVGQLGGAVSHGFLSHGGSLKPWGFHAQMIWLGNLHFHKGNDP